MLQGVMEIQKTLGQQTEALKTVRGELDTMSAKLDGVVTQVHTAQTVMKVVGGIITAAILFLGWLAATFVGPVLDRIYPTQ